MVPEARISKTIFKAGKPQPSTGKINATQSIYLKLSEILKRKTLERETENKKVGGGRGGIERHKMEEWRLWEKEMQMRNWEREIIINKKCRKENYVEREKVKKS